MPGRIKLLAYYSTNASQIVYGELPAKKSTLIKFQEIRNGPTFKYWFVGTTAFFSWMVYYGMKTYKKTRINVEILPPLPQHEKVKRESEIGELFEKYNASSGLFDGTKIKRLFVSGPSASGKTMLVYDFLRDLQEKQKGLLFGFLQSNVIVFLQCDTESSFLSSLKAFAAKLNVKPSELKEQLEDSDNTFTTASFEVQCNCLLACIQDALQKHPRWIIVFDNIQTLSSPSVFHVLNEWFVKNSDTWSSGTAVIIHDGNVKDFFKLKNESCYSMRKG